MAIASQVWCPPCEEKASRTGRPVQEWCATLSGQQGHGSP